ncbi:hypothetical protein [Flavobacterium sp. HNIBRBA15423]|uniref:hypothetical protein n=1 Tax=Flavobacterium sp. HNIBRBA15423 TaxID=3458683 RepID=UPI0040451639
MKGVAKIRWSGKGNVDKSKSKPNVTLAVLPKNDIGFIVDKWFDETTEEEKKKSVTWILQDKERKEIRSIQKSVKEEFTLNIPNALCGSYTYYLEASLSGNIDRNNNTGLWIIGKCTPKIVSSKWSTSVDGEDVRKQQFKYGQLVYLNLTTEGLNGSKNLTIEVYQVIQEGGGSKDDKLIFTYTSVDVIDGEVNLKIGNTANWFVYAKSNLEGFYVKVKDAFGNYVTDGKDDIHARFLRLKKEQVTKKTETPTNNTPLKVGETTMNFLRYDACKYISFKDNKTVLFDEENLKKGIKNQPLINLLYLVGENKGDIVTITITDNKKPRCDYHKDKIFDITQLQKNGFSKVSEKENSFSFDSNYNYSYKNDYLKFAQEYLLPVPALKAIVPLQTCAYRHTLNIKLFPDVAWAVHFTFDNPPKKYFKDINSITLQRGLDKEIEYVRKELINSNIKLFYQLPDFMNKWIIDIGLDYLKNLANYFAFGIHAYHSFDANNKNPQILDYTAKYPWIAKTVIVVYVVLSLIIEAVILYLTRGKGMATKVGKVVTTTRKYSNTLTDKMENKDLSFITPKIIMERSQCFEEIDGTIYYIIKEKVQALPLFGIQYEKEHTLGSFVASKIGITKVFDLARQTVSLVGNIKMLKKISKWASGDKTPEKISNNPLELRDARTALDYAEDKIEDKITDIGKALGQELSFKLTVKGEYQAHYEVSFNLAQNAVTLKELLENYTSKGPKATFGRKKGIDAIAECELKSDISITTEWIFNYAPKFIEGYVPKAGIEAKGEGKAEIHGSLFYERIYSIDNKEAYYIDQVLFSGIAGSVKGQANVDISVKGQMKKNQSKTVDKSFILMEPYVLKGKKIPLFSKESFKEHF